MKQVTKSRRMRWSGSTPCEREARIVHRVLGRKPKGKRPFEDLVVDVKTQTELI